MWHTFWKGKLEFGLISFWMSKWFSLIHLILFANNLHVWRFLPEVGTKLLRHKNHPTFFPKSSPSKTEYHLATKKTSSNPVACCHFVKESQVSPPDISSAEQLYRSCSCTITEVKSSHHFRFASHRFGTTWPSRSDPHFFRKSNMSKWEKFTGKFGFGNTPLKKCHGSQSPIHAKGVFCPKKMVGPNHASCWNQSEIFCQHSLKKLHSRSPTTRRTTSKPLTTQPQQPIPSKKLVKVKLLYVYMCTFMFESQLFCWSDFTQGLWLIPGIGLNTSNIVRFRHLDLGHQLPVTAGDSWEVLRSRTKHMVFLTFGGWINPSL